MLCLEVLVGWNRREEQAADELKRINHVNGWSFLLFFYLVQGSGFKVEVAASPPFLEDGILVSQPSPLGEGVPQGRIG